MASPEKVLTHRILLRHGSRPDLRLWRNETGTFKAPDGSYVSCGLCKGSSDLIGIKIVGSCGMFIAIEVKTAGTATTDLQTAFIEQIIGMGGIAGIVGSLEDVDVLLGVPPK